MSSFNPVDKFYRIALSRNQIKPAARDHQALGQAQNFIGNRIAMMMVVKQPAVKIALLQS